MRKMLTIGVVALALALAGCSGGSMSPSSGGGGYGDGSSTPTTSSTPSAPSSAAMTDVQVATTSLGEVVTDGKGMTLYRFDKDTQGATTSACTGVCLTNWPPLIASGSAPTGTVTGTLGTIATPDGKKQVTLDGWPLYTFNGDTAAGDVKGQGVGGIWWAVTSAGAKVGG